MKIRPVGAMATDGQPDRHDETHSRFSQILRKAPEVVFCMAVRTKPIYFPMYALTVFITEMEFFTVGHELNLQIRFGLVLSLKG
jgi:hypothetical protein